MDYVSEQPQLKHRVFAERLVGQGPRDGTMTDIQQENTLRRFRAGCISSTSSIQHLACAPRRKHLFSVSPYLSPHTRNQLLHDNFIPDPHLCAAAAAHLRFLLRIWAP